MAFCKYCGKEIEDGSPFCKYCGGRLLSADEPHNSKSKKNRVVLGCLLIFGLLCMAGLAFFAIRQFSNNGFLNSGSTPNKDSNNRLISEQDDDIDELERLEEDKSEKDDAPEIEKTDIEVGDTVAYGRYWPFENDYSLEELYHPVEWEVLDIVDGKALLLSTEILDACDFTWGSENESWEGSYLRSWCQYFYETAFLGGEEVCICKTTIDNSYPKWVVAESKGETEDYVFFLSWDELNKYFGEDEDLYSDQLPGYHFFLKAACAVSEGAKEKGIYAVDFDEFVEKGRMSEKLEGKEIGTWWLRSYGMDGSCLGMYVDYCLVEEVGFVPRGGDEEPKGIGCRPAMWVDVDSFVPYYIVEKQKVKEPSQGFDINYLDDKVVIKICDQTASEQIDMKQLGAYDVSEWGYYNWTAYSGDANVYEINEDGSKSLMEPLLPLGMSGFLFYFQESFEEGKTYSIKIADTGASMDFVYHYDTPDENFSKTNWPYGAKEALESYINAETNKQFISEMVTAYGNTSVMDNSPTDEMYVSTNTTDYNGTYNIRIINVMMYDDNRLQIGDVYFIKNQKGKNEVHIGAVEVNSTFY